MLKSLETTRRFRCTPKGVLTNMYHKMKSRRPVEFTLAEFHIRFINDEKFLRLHSDWVNSGMDKMLKPSLDRINNNLDYTVRNTHMLTWAENRHKQTMERRSRKGVVIQYLNGVEVDRFKSQRLASIKSGIAQGNISSVMNGKRPHAEGFTFKFEYELSEDTHQDSELLENK